MRSKIFKRAAASALSFLLILQNSVVTLAESAENQEATGMVTTERAVGGELTHTVTHQTNGLKFNITYPADIKCGQPTTFKFSLDDPNKVINQAEGAKPVQYRIGSLIIYDGSEYVSVYDVSYGQNSAYSPNDTYDFTFYASGTYYIGFSVLYQRTEDGKFDYIQTGYGTNGIKLEVRDSSYPSVEEIVDRVAGECLVGCSTDYEKALWLNDWLVDHCEYDNSYQYCSAEGALARGIGTCEAYHRAYVMLLNKVNIPAGRITGNGHVWTAVRMDGKWYQVDTTWNDPGYGDSNVDLKHLYFGLNDDITTKVHPDHRPVAGYESTSLEQNYFIKSGEISKWSGPLMDTVKQHIAAGDTSFTIEIARKAPGASDYASAYATVLYNLVAHVLMNTDWSGSDASDIQLSASYTPADAYSGTMTCTVQYTDTGGNPDSGGSSADGSGTGNGSAAGTWKRNGIGWWFQYPDGSYPFNAWEKIDGEWYWFNSRGYMAVGWQKINGTWYYLTGSGAMATGWQLVTGTWYYLEGSGAMATGWRYIDGFWYYLTGSGAMATGWQKVNGTWYYLTGSGAMATGWQLVSGTWYYLEASGAMATGWRYIDGFWYYLTGSGAMATGWQKVNGTWYYLNPNGSMAADTWIGEFYVNKDGAWVV